jgi:prevent-host-death family protein
MMYIMNELPHERGLPLATARQTLSPLVKSIARKKAVAIRVRGKVKAYLVSAAHYEGLEATVRALGQETPPTRVLWKTLRGGDNLELGASPSELLLQQAGRSWKRR